MLLKQICYLELSMATSYMVPEIIAMDSEKLENYLKLRSYSL